MKIETSGIVHNVITYIEQAVVNLNKDERSEVYDQLANKISEEIMQMYCDKYIMTKERKRG